MSEKTCSYCGKPFHPSLYHPDQQICGAVRCQRRRRAEYHRNKILGDPAYKQQCHDSQKHWRERNRTYMKHYRQRRHQERQEQKGKIQSLGEFVQLLDLVKNNVAPDCSRINVDVWMMPQQAIPSGKNSFARTQILVFPANFKGVLYAED